MTSPDTREAGGASERESVQPVERREWWPLSFVDEDMPSGADTPDAFLSVDFDGGHAYRAPDDPDYDHKSLFEGDVVEFVCRDALGTSRLTLENDEPHWNPTVPAACNNLWDGDEEVADSPGELVDLIRQNIASGLSDKDFLVRLSRWSTVQLRFRFTALDGPPRFVPLDPIPEPPGIFLTPPTDPQSDIFATQERL